MFTIEVSFLFRGHLHGNNSIVTLTEIGEGDSALLCITNSSDCCRGMHLSEMGIKREWHYPDGTAVQGKDSGNIYRNRDPSVVRLNRRNNVTSPTGIYRCEIPDDHSDKVLHIGIYNAEGGKYLHCILLCYLDYTRTVCAGSPSITSFTINIDTNSLVCISSGGPATKVIWMKNNQQLIVDGTAYQQTQTIVDSVNAIIENVLISVNRTNLVGTFSFTCIVENARGKANKSLSTNGMSSIVQVV